jgi:TIR domain
MMDHIFLSYSFKDIERARRLRDALRLYGVEVWPSGTLTPGSPSWRAELQAQIEQASCVVVILTRDTPQSSWVTTAINQAAKSNIPILPVVMDGEPAHRLLIDLQGDPWFDLRWSRNFAAEIRELVIQIHRYQFAKIVRDV